MKVLVLLQTNYYVLRTSLRSKMAMFTPCFACGLTKAHCITDLQTTSSKLLKMRHAKFSEFQIFQNLTSALELWHIPTCYRTLHTSQDHTHI